MIQRGFDQIGAIDWVLHLDADIVLPRKFRKYLEWAHVDPKVIYGADRCNLTGWDEWRRLKQYAGAWDNHAHECGHWFHPKFQVGSRWVSKIHGYVPIGFFQLFHGIGDGRSRVSPAQLSARARRRGPDRRPVRPSVGSPAPTGPPRGDRAPPRERAISPGRQLERPHDATIRAWPGRAENAGRRTEDERGQRNTVPAVLTASLERPCACDLSSVLGRQSCVESSVLFLQSSDRRPEQVPVSTVLTFPAVLRPPSFCEVYACPLKLRPLP